MTRPFAAVAIALAALWGSTLAAAKAQEGASPERLRLNPLNALKPSDLQAFKRRPLFAPSRAAPPAEPRRDERPPIVVIPSGKEPPRIQLTGVVEGIASPVAILQRADASAPSMVRIGDDVEGWLVISIDSLSIVLKSGAREHEYKLFSNDPAPVAAPETAAPNKERRINHPPIDIGRNLRNKPPS